MEFAAEKSKICCNKNCGGILPPSLIIPTCFLQEKLISNISQILTQSTALYSLNVDLNVSQSVAYRFTLQFYCRSLKLSMAMLTSLPRMCLFLEHLLCELFCDFKYLLDSYCNALIIIIPNVAAAL